MRISLVYANLRGERIPALGLAYIAASLEAKHEVQVIDCTWHREKWQQYLRRKIEEHQPDLIGFTATHWEFADAIGVAQETRRIYRRVPIIFGGIHPSLAPSEVLSHPEVDAICLGEGETTIQEYVARMEQGEEPEGIAGIWYKRNEKIVRAPLRPFDCNLDAIPFPNWDMWEIEEYLAYPIHPHILFMIGQRGCPFRCSFCEMPVFSDNFPGKYTRHRSAENLVAEVRRNIEKYYDAGFRIINFSDNVFGLERRNFYRFCELYRAAGFHEKVIWDCSTRADVINDKWVEAAKSAGCYRVKMGVEAGDDYVRNVIHNKELELEDVRSIDKVMHRHDVLRQYNFIFGAPGETVETMKKTACLIKELKPDFLFYSLYQPLEATEGFKNIQKAGGQVNQEAWKNNPNFWFQPMVDTSRLKASQVRRFMLKLLVPFFFILLAEGIRMRGLKYIYDLAKGFFYLKWKYRFPFIYVYVYTILQYRVENWAWRNNLDRIFRASPGRRSKVGREVNHSALRKAESKL